MTVISALTVLLVSLIQGLISTSTPNGDTDVAVLRNTVLQLQKAVSDLQSQAQAEVQTNARMFTSVLSKLTETNDDLNDVKSELQSLKGEHAYLQTEVEALKFRVKGNEHPISNLSMNDNSTTNDLSVMRKNLTEMRSDQNMFESKLQHVLAELVSVENVTVTKSDLEKKMSEAVSELKSQLLTQDHKYGAVLSSVLSKLTVTTADLTHVQSEMKTVKDNYTLLLSDLSTLEVKVNKDQDEISNISKVINLNTDDLDLMGKDKADLKSDRKIVKDNCSSFHSDLFTLELKIDNNQDEISNISEIINSTTNDLKLMGSNIAELRSDLNMSETHLQLVLSELASVKTDLHMSVENVTAMKSELEKVMSELSNLKSIKAENGILNSTIQTASLLHHVASTQSGLLSKLANTEMSIQSLNESMSNVTQILKTIQPLSPSHGAAEASVAFRVVHPLDDIFKQGTALLDFPSTSYNYGGAFDLFNRKFTAPVNGLYLFWLNAVIMGSVGPSNITVNIETTKGRIGSAYKDVPGFNSQDTLNAVVVAHVSKGESVWFMYHSGGRNVKHKGLSSYGGILLYRL